MIAQVPAPFLQDFWLVILSALAGAASVATIAGVFRHKRGTVTLDPPIPQPSFETKPAAQYVTREMCEEHHHSMDRRASEQAAEIRQLWERMNSDKTSFNAEARSRSAGIYAKIDEVRKELNASQECIRKEVAMGFRDMERVIGQLEGKITK